MPIVGRELLWSTFDGQRRYIPRVMADRLAGPAGLPPADPTDSDPVGTLVELYLKKYGKQRSWPYIAVSRITSELAAISPPDAFLQLAELPFSLLVSTTTDGYLERALNMVRFGGAAHTQVPRYGLRSKVDLPERAAEPQTTVFPLLGLANSTGDYALTDEDVLEFVYQFQATDTPKRLLQTLRQRHVLLIGGGFSDWLLRFLVRLTRPDRLWASNAGQLTHFISDRGMTSHLKSLSFFQHPFTDVEVFSDVTAEEFAAELHQRWTSRYPDGFDRGRAQPPAAVDRVDVESRVFLSYSSEDHDLACLVRDRLDRAGIDVWFDKRELNSGDEFQEKIARQIFKSYFFVTLLSRHSLAPPPRFFLFEWREAEGRSRFHTFDGPYIRPVALEGIAREDDRLPEFIRRLHWVDAPGGVLPDSFVSQIVDDYRQARLKSQPR